MSFSNAEIATALWPNGSPLQQLSCGHCGRVNRVALDAGVLNPERCRCGQCHEPLFVAQDAPLVELSHEDYAHPLDKRSLRALESLPGYPKLMRKLRKFTDRKLHLLWMANDLRCSPAQHPELVAHVEVARQRLGLEQKVEIYLGGASLLSPHSAGVEQPMLRFNPLTTKQLEPNELRALIGHQLGHIQAEHGLYLWLARNLIDLGMLPFSSFARLLNLPLSLALGRWQRCADLSADRAALLVSGDLSGVLSLFSKMAMGLGLRGGPDIRLAPLVDQVRYLQQVEQANTTDLLLSLANTVDRREHLVLWRLMHLIEWLEGGDYLRLLAQQARRTSGEKP